MKTKPIDIPANLIITDDQGNWDVDASVDQFEQILSEKNELRNANLDTIHEAARAMFAENPHTSFNKAAMETKLVSKIGFTDATHGEIKRRVHEALKSDAYYMGKGPSAGIRLSTEEERAYKTEHGTWPKAEKKSNVIEI